MATPQETSDDNMATGGQQNCASCLGSNINTVVKPACDVIKPVCSVFIKLVKPLVSIEENVGGLNTNTKTLMSQKLDIEGKIETDRRNGLVETNEAKNWLARADKAISDAERNRERYEQRRKIFGCCPNVWLDHKISTRAVKMNREVKECTSTKPENPTVEPLAPPPKLVEFISVDETISVKASQDHIVKDVLRYIKDDATVGLVGIWGPRQVGKTLLLTMINNSFCTGNSTVHSSSFDIVEVDGSPAFDFVIYITSSEEWSVQRIQSKIMQRLKIQGDGLASSKISRFLSDKSFLVLLDDLRNYVDMAEVGIPGLGVHGQLKQKVVITTGSQTLCRKMKVNKDIYVPGLKLDEALELFRDSAGEDKLCSDPNIRKHMECLVEMLRVLPTELKNFGRDMCDKGEPKQWEDVIHVVKELMIHTEDQEGTSLRERIVIKLKEDVKKLRDMSRGIRDKIELARADSIVADGMAIYQSERTEANWDISIAAAKLREIEEYINDLPSPSGIAQPPPPPGMEIPHCSRCLTKGHVMSECTTAVICDLCGLDEHVTEACPLQDGAKPKAEPCGFAVDGLGFYFIPYSGKQKVEESGEDSFITSFPSKIDLERMMLWSPVKAKCSEAKMVTEDKSKSEECKSVIPKVWVQFRGLSEELMEPPVIWAVGSILGVTCLVDMEFTNKHGRARLNVAVLNPNLIPDLVKVVIGDYVYKLQFRVENKDDAHSPKLIDMDTEPQQDDDHPIKEDQQDKENDINIGESHGFMDQLSQASSH